jgi:hypothetical protein
MTPSILGQATLQAIKCLKESGEKSFEILTATLLSLLIGFPIRLCKSGYQAGIDAMADPAEIPVAVAAKRYQSGPSILTTCGENLWQPLRPILTCSSGCLRQRYR